MKSFYRSGAGNRTARLRSAKSKTTSPRKSTNGFRASLGSTTARLIPWLFALALILPSEGRAQTVVAQIFNEGAPDSVAVNPVTNKIYVANFSTVGTCNVIDGATNTVTATLTTGSFPFALAVNPVTNKIYVLSFLNNGSVSVIDGATNTVLSTTGIPTNPSGLGINPLTNKIYVATFEQVTVIDGATDTVVTTIASPTPSSPPSPSTRPPTRFTLLTSEATFT